MEPNAQIGVIGAGWWATDTHIPALNTHPNAELVAICDASPERLKAAATKYQIAHTYTDVHDMLSQERLDGAVVASSNASHYIIAKQCLEQGLHVMLEKPMTLLARESKELVELAQTHQCNLIVGYPFNYKTYAIEAQKLIQSGRLGAIQYINLIYNSYMMPFFTGTYQADVSVHLPDQYTRPDQVGGGHGQVQLTHAAGLLFFITGLQPQRVIALMANQGLAVDLINVMTVQFEGDALGSVSGTGNQQGLTFRLHIGGEHGWLEIDCAANLAIVHWNSDRSSETLSDALNKGYPGYATAHNLVDVILGKAENGSPGEVGWRAVELLEAAYRSAAQQGQAVAIADLY